MHCSKLKKLANFRDFAESSSKFCKILGKSPKSWNFLRILLHVWVWSDAKECRSCRFWKILKNAPILAIRGINTAENEPSKVAKFFEKCIFALKMHFLRWRVRCARTAGDRFVVMRRTPAYLCLGSNVQREKLVENSSHNCIFHISMRFMHHCRYFVVFWETWNFLTMV